MATKTKKALDWTDAELSKLNFRIVTEYGDDHTVWALWHKLNSDASPPKVVSDTKYKHIGKISINWYKRLPTSDGGSNWIIMKSATEYSKGTTRTEEISVPQDALEIRAGIRLVVSDSYKSDYKTGSYHYEYYPYSTVPVPSTPSEPNVNFDSNTNRVTVSQNITDDTVTSVQFKIYTVVGGVESENPIESNIITVPSSRTVTYQFNGTPGYTYRAKAVWFNNQGGSTESSGSGSAESEAVPSQITGLSVNAYSISPPTVMLDWDPDSAAARTNGYDIERATEERFLGTSQSTITSSNGPPDIISVEVGSTWWFRVRAKNQSGTLGPWSGARSITMALKPGPPTTWSLYSSYKIGDPIVLYWTYNSRDGSKPSTSKVYWRINGGTLQSKTIQHTYPEEQTEFTFFWDITEEIGSTLHDGDRLTWYVTSYGIGSEESDPSIEREIVVHIPPEVWVTFPSEVETYPLDIDINVLPTSQHLVSGVITIQNVNTYETVNRIGEDIVVNAGTIIYSQVFDGSYGNHFVLSLDPSNVELITDEEYLISVKVSLDSGLMADNSNQYGRFTTHFEKLDIILDSGVVFNSSTYVASLTPGCYYMDEDGEATDEMVPNFVIDVYRINNNGELVEITKNLPNDGTVTVLDPHPSLDAPSYRIVGTDMATGFKYYMNTFTDNTGVKGIIIQWDESYKNYLFGTTDDPDQFGAAYNGMILELPFNVKMTDSSDMDVELIEYIGRENPVSYYGTQQGKQATWSCEFDKTNSETLYKLRHLDRWKGDVYVRHQSGIGYWANVKVSYNEDYDNLVIPASFQITKVDSKKP